ncbi:hypothetical protein TMS3_0107570 [Pseudomonas taeanensis MS-3]|jgi:hypothetical protein|uniref:Uncharacterized protein n=1 Tax=Pseudomonas taeanensis MS-3 TaxID=1395571 RepID=A0A0A1YRF2_9PSED|nr:hypothetical protein TMS3_0107570 [Pseudomonas taeanensis MS-3]
MSKLKLAEEKTQQQVQHLTEELSLALAVKLDAMRQAKVSTSEELAETMYPLLQAMTSLALENQVLMKEMRSMMREELSKMRAEMGELHTLMTELKSLSLAPRSGQVD